MSSDHARQSRIRLIRKLRQARSILRMVRGDLRAVRASASSLDSELSAVESVLDDCAPRVVEGETLSPSQRVLWLADENAKLTATVDAAARDHAAVEAERAELERDALDAHDTLDRAQITHVGGDGAAMRPALPLRVVAAARDLRAVSKLRDQLQRDLKSARAAADLYLAQAREAQAERERVEAERRAIADAYNAIAGELTDLKRARDTARSAADLYLAQAQEAQAERERLAGEVAELKRERDEARRDRDAARSERNSATREHLLDLDRVRDLIDGAFGPQRQSPCDDAIGTLDRLVREERDAHRAKLAAIDAEQTKLYQCASEQGEADVANGLVLVRKADLLALRSRQTGADAATVRLLHDLLDRLIVVDGRGGVA